MQRNMSAMGGGGDARGSLERGVFSSAALPQYMSLDTSTIPREVQLAHTARVPMLGCRGQVLLQSMVLGCELLSSSHWSLTRPRSEVGIQWAACWSRPWSYSQLLPCEPVAQNSTGTEPCARLDTVETCYPGTSPSTL